MKDLLLAIQSELRASIDTVVDSAICIVRSESYIPPSVRSPAIGLKDGQVTFRRLAGGVVETTARVLVVAWVQILDDYDASIMGGAQSTPGVLDLVSQIITALDDNMLALPGMQSANIVECRPSEPMGINTTTLQRKIAIFEYVRESEGTPCGN